MPIGKPLTVYDEDLTDELKKRLAGIIKAFGTGKGGLKFTLVEIADPKDASHTESFLMPMSWTESLENASFDLRRTGLSCLILDDAFTAMMNFMNAKLKGKTVAVVGLRPSVEKVQDDPLRMTRQPRRLIFRYVDYTPKADAEPVLAETPAPA
jgi:hypothetical protein